MKRMERRQDCMVVGVTGGIASGKTTVADMLGEMGAEIIDFDVLARQVVEPGQPALDKIAAYFGKDVLTEDGTLDRKKLSGIVFGNPEKLKVLESFTHPAISQEYFRQIAQMESGSLILAVIPLLFEFGLEYLPDKILVVYVPRAEQIRRLMRRDRISEWEAANIIRTQLPIDEKLAKADFVIRNDKSPGHAREQAEALWHALMLGERRYA